jgi:hypothetical protein
MMPNVQWVIHSERDDAQRAVGVVGLEKGLCEMKHQPEERLACIEQWFPEAERDQRRPDLLYEVLAFAGPTSATDLPISQGLFQASPDA